MVSYLNFSGRYYLAVQGLSFNPRNPDHERELWTNLMCFGNCSRAVDELFTTLYITVWWVFLAIKVFILTLLFEQSWETALQTMNLRLYEKPGRVVTLLGTSTPRFSQEMSRPSGFSQDNASRFVPTPKKCSQSSKFLGPRSLEKTNIFVAFAALARCLCHVFCWSAEVGSASRVVPLRYKLVYNPSTGKCCHKWSCPNSNAHQLS